MKLDPPPPTVPPEVGAPCDRATLAATNSGGTAPPTPSLLIVDDAPANLELLAGLFRARGFRVRPVPSGELALLAARHDPPALILLDIQMPGLDGYETCQQLQADPSLQPIPVIFISALDGAIDKVKAFGVGGVDYVTKPFQFEEVEARVCIHLELARLRRELARHNAHLELAVAERTRELADACGRLSVLDRAKSDFLRLISHELSTPLHGILGATELLLLACAHDPATAEYASIYHSSRRRLLTLLDDALLLTQIGVGAVGATEARCPLAEELHHARLQARPLAESRGVHLAPVPCELGWVHGTAGHLLRAFQALLETAAKFANPGSTVWLLRAEAPPGEIGLRFVAEGRGIPVAALPHFFALLAIEEPLILGDDLGLAPPLAQRILALYGGRVTVASLDPPGLGLTVYLKTAVADP